MKEIRVGQSSCWRFVCLAAVVFLHEGYGNFPVASDIMQEMQEERSFNIEKVIILLYDIQNVLFTPFHIIFSSYFRIHNE